MSQFYKNNAVYGKNQQHIEHSLTVVIQQTPLRREKENETQDISRRELEPPNDRYIQPLERKRPGKNKRHNILGQLMDDTRQHSQRGWTDVCVCADLLGNTMRKA